MTNAAAVDNSSSLVHVAILRKVRRGCEAEFEAKLTEFFAAAAQRPGVAGAYLIRAVPGSSEQEYGVLRTFRSEADMREFYASDTYLRWQDEVRPLVQGEPQKRKLYGLEAFFRDSDRPPPHWKMAVLTWVGVNPAVYIFSSAVPAVLGPLPMLATLLIVNALVVASLAWGFMPVLTHIFQRWLQPRVP
ncbi:antibiotic biosynthesis monooxygenase [Steroidobacter sp. S1-65]|uniref:Antibiotic biosynthesis monooxygenase n=1 Tax=Steroidobacter gossypii TaxID=2805490 RepID=A0ABS1X5R3_9GAMM|nr:antibiotic biosynthesis monooxygenase [Steroidobacter gossypii]MBM0108564.1 antibiotic biosynthesis monooxygenase [Steroidobacter gossypii]